MTKFIFIGSLIIVFACLMTFFFAWQWRAEREARMILEVAIQDKRDEMIMVAIPKDLYEKQITTGDKILRVKLGGEK